MNNDIFENICKDDFYFINKHDVNWLVIKNHNDEYMYYDVDEIEKTGDYTAYEYDDKNSAITYGIKKRSEKLERDKQERAQQNLAKKVHEDLKKGEEKLRNDPDYIGEDYNNDEINRKLSIELFLKKYNIENRFADHLNGKVDNIGKKLIEKDNGIGESFEGELDKDGDDSIKKKLKNAIKAAKESYKGIKDGGEKTDQMGNRTKFLADIARKCVDITASIEQLILDVLMRRDKIIEELKKELKKKRKKVSQIQDQMRGGGKLTETQAATKIQALQRGKQGRKATAFQEELIAAQEELTAAEKALQEANNPVEVNNFTKSIMTAVFKVVVSDENDVKKLEKQKENLKKIENELEAKMKKVSIATTMEKLLGILEYPSS